MLNVKVVLFQDVAGRWSHSHESYLLGEIGFSHTVINKSQNLYFWRFDENPYEDVHISNDEVWVYYLKNKLNKEEVIKL